MMLLLLNYIASKIDEYVWWWNDANGKTEVRVLTEKPVFTKIPHEMACD